jgi:adenine-specific DNA-methyltransferase
MSIDENELDNLIKLGNEVFGESNKISEIVWEKKTGASDSKTISSVTEYVLIYLKDINSSESVFNKNLNSFDPNRYKHEDKYFEERGPFYFDTLDRGGLQYSDSLNYKIHDKEGKSTYPNGRKEFINDGWIWKWSESKVKWGFENGFIEIRKSNNKESGHSVYYKNYLKVNNEGNPIERSAPKKNLIKGVKNLDGSKDIKGIFDSRVFDYPKPVKYLIELFEYIKTENEYVLDFFSGSSSSAHAVLMSNLKSNQISKYIQVQLPEKTDKKSDAYLQGYSIISDIGKERIRRVVQKIKEENPEKSKEMDLGFKVFKLDSSNIKSWDGNPENLETSLFDAVGNIKTDRTEEDVLYEILLKYGLDLTLPIEERIIEGKKVFNVGLGSLFICLADDITAKVAEGIGQWKEACSPEICRVIFKDNGFTDVEKTNSVQTLKRYGINEIRSI